MEESSFGVDIVNDITQIGIGRSIANADNAKICNEVWRETNI